MGQGFLIGLGAADSTDATATTEQIKTGYTAYVNDVKLTGTYGPDDIVGRVVAGHIVAANSTFGADPVLPITISLTKSYLVFATIGGNGLYEGVTWWVGKLVNGTLTALNTGSDYGTSGYVTVTISGTTLTASLVGSTPGGMFDDGGIYIAAVEIIG